MASVGTAEIALRVDRAGLSGQIDQAGQEVSSKLSRAGRAAVGALAAVGVGAVARASLREADEAQKVAARTENVLRTTRGVANVTEKDVSRLADSLSKTAAVDDEVVQGAENLLLTFTRVRNVGPEKIFDRTTAAVLDMSAALGTDANGAAIQLGKALSDPVKGLLGLRRAGVSFTEQQKEQIKTLAESGRMLEAQKIVLGEVETEFGGAAQAMATDSDRARVAMGNLQENIGTALQPVVTLAAQAAGAFSDLPDAVQTAAVVAGIGAGAWLRYGDSIKDAANSTRDLIKAQGGAASSAGKLGIVAAAVAGTFEGSQFAVGKLADRLDDVDAASVTSDLRELGATGKVPTRLVEQLGPGLKDLADDFRTLDSRMHQWSNNPLLRAGGITDGLAGQFRASQKEVDKLDKSLAQALGSGNTARVNEAKSAFATITRQLGRQGIDADTVRRRFDDYATALGNLKADKVADVADNTKRAGSAARDAATDVRELRKSYKDLADTTEAFWTGVLSNFDAQLAVGRADRNRAQAQSELAIAQEKAKSGKPEDIAALADARDNLTNAIKDEAQAVADAGGQGQTAAQKHQLFIDVLDGLAGRLDPNNPVRQNLQGLAGDLSAVNKQALDFQNLMHVNAFLSGLQQRTAQQSTTRGSSLDSHLPDADRTGRRGGSKVVNNFYGAAPRDVDRVLAGGMQPR